MRANCKAMACMMMTTVGLAACDGILDPAQPGNLVAKTVDEDPALPSVSLAGTVFHAETFGDPGKPAVIFLHRGPGGDYRSLQRLNQRHDGYALTDDHLVVMWDQRGSGLSRRHDCDVYTSERMEADLDAIVDHFSPGRPVILIGDSWGGMYATLYINHHPDKVAAAVLMEPGPLNGQMFDAVAGDLFDLNRFSEWLNDDLWDELFFSPDDHARADYHMMLGVRDSQPRSHNDPSDPSPFWRPGAITSRCLQASAVKNGKATYDFTDHLAAFTKPVLFIAGANSEVEGTAFQQRQRQFYSASKLVTIAGSGHEVGWMRPAETLAAVHAYLAEVQQ